MKNRLLIDGCKNFRDLGGNVNKYGEETKIGRFYRSDSLSDLSDNDIDSLRKNEVYTIIDLRTKEEIYSSPDRISKFNEFSYYNIPLIDNVYSTDQGDVKNFNLPDLYRYLVDSSNENISKVFRLMLGNPKGGVVFHCTAGKDRTGVVAALLLLLADIPSNRIIEDYSISSKNMFGEITDSLIINGNSTPKHMLLSEPEYMEEFIEYINMKYNGVKSFLKEKCNLSLDSIYNLRYQLIS